MTTGGFYEGKKVLVTGGSGFVGTHFVRQLLGRGADVRVPLHIRPMLEKDPRVEIVACDLANLNDCLKAFSGVDYVFHAAGVVFGAGVGGAGQMSGISTNLILTARTLEAAWMSDVKRVLIFSSGATVYPAANHPVKEEEMWDGPPTDAYFGYGWMRRYMELLGQFVEKKSEVGVAICRPTAIYGRHDNFDPKTSHVLPALIRKAVEKENPFIAWGTGDEERDFLHVDDLVRGCLLLLEKHATGDPVNLGYGATVSIKEALMIILKAAGHENAKVVFDSAKPSTISIRSVDISKARRLLGFEPLISLEEGLRDAVEWYSGAHGCG
ncbi:MAG: NAD-dependent epimerase/dehydratase family protein [Nitrospinae bacterium]|nr:NAD-dependent epimerase/dehydratase family protein [Nitrospinota bacterium]